MSVEIRDILERGVAQVVVKDELEKALQSGKKLKVKLGIDPTGSDLHLGHMVVLRKLRQFQDAGHQAILVIGDFTGKIGDPSGRTEARKPLTDAVIKQNAKTYLEQAGKVLNLKKLKVVHNSKWLDKLSFGDVVKLAHSFTVAQMLERDMYQDRIKKDLPIGLHEFLYPLMQGYDSVALEADVELGGTDQTFNLLAGREIQRFVGQKPQNVLTVPILEGLDGKQKMSKTYNNYIGVLESAQDMYGKTMSLPDELIVRYFELCTTVPLDAIQQITQDLAKGTNPRDLKMRLAKEIVTLYHSPEDAKIAEEKFVKQFQKHELPEDIPIVTVKAGAWGILDLIVEVGLEKSKTEIRRLIDQGGVKVDGAKVSEWNFQVTISKKPTVVQLGKRKLVNVVGL